MTTTPNPFPEELMDINRTTDRMRRMAGTERVRQMQHLPTRTVRFVPSDLFLWGAAGSILVSLALRLAGRKQDALFIGEWPPTMISLGVLARLLGR